MTILLLIRHGENDWVGAHRLAGRTPGVHLNDKGRQQAQEVADRLGPQPITAIYSSPLERCMETAQPLAAALGLEVIPHPGVIEADYGAWQGANLKDLAKQPEWELVQGYPSGFRFPGGETLREVQSRMVAALAQIVEDHPKQVVAVFSHSDVIKSAVAHFVGAPLDLFQRIMIDTASVSVIGFHRAGPHIIRINDTGFLPVFKQTEEDPKEEVGTETPGSPDPESTHAEADTEGTQRAQAGGDQP